MSETKDELESWQREIASLVTQAMQAGILMWNLEPVKSMQAKEVASLMAQLQTPFVLKIFSVVEQQFGEKSSS